MLRIRHLLITVNTNNGQFGTQQDFADGLNVVRAENYAGKSILLQSIIYALGLEGMLAPTHDVPLPHAVTDYLDHAGGRSNVIDAMVSLEVENGAGGFLTIQRSIAGERHRHLVTVYEGRAITHKEALESRRDYFVREAYAAVSERGFHRRLAEFLGWTIPVAPRFNDTDCPLYLETIFPLLYVEQKLGWGRIPARYPTWLGIRDVGRRTVEFLLGLDAYAIAVERTAVENKIAQVRAEWTTLRTQTGKAASASGGLLNGVPPDPISAWPPEVLPQILMSRASDWIPLPTYLARLRERLQALSESEIPGAGADQSRLRVELTQAQSVLAEREQTVTALVEKLESDSSEAQALSQRIEAIEDDLRKYKDVRRIRTLGSSDEPDSEKGVCPTCHQELGDSLLVTGQKTIPMSVEQNVTFYEEQLQLFNAILDNARRSIQGSQIQLQSEREEVESLRERVKSLRETLVSPSGVPSIEIVTERIRLEQRIANLEVTLSNFEDSLAEFAQLAGDWKDVQARRARLPKGALSVADENKINAFQEIFRQQLLQYKMGSVDPRELKISRDNYSPELGELNLRADVAGSDLIRLQWAYLLGLLELGLSMPTNHPGLLIMDEPQQQSVEEGAFLSMLEYAANFKKAQIIIGTSHERDGLALSLRISGFTTSTSMGTSG